MKNDRIYCIFYKKNKKWIGPWHSEFWSLDIAKEEKYFCKISVKAPTQIRKIIYQTINKKV